MTTLITLNVTACQRYSNFRPTVVNSREMKRPTPCRSREGSYQPPAVVIKTVSFCRRITRPNLYQLVHKQIIGSDQS